jgi:trehalose-6-phosphate synthase
MDRWAGYVRANAAYAERIIESVSSDGTVWINGHRWLLVASALRGYGHRGPIGLLLDVPFPPRARLEALPWYAEVIAALCQLDLLGFQTQECADNFEACRARVGGNRPWIEVAPSCAGSARGAEPTEWVASFLQRLTSAARRDVRPALIG